MARTRPTHAARLVRLAGGAFAFVTLSACNPPKDLEEAKKQVAEAKQATKAQLKAAKEVASEHAEAVGEQVADASEQAAKRVGELSKNAAESVDRAGKQVERVAVYTPIEGAKEAIQCGEGKCVIDRAFVSQVAKRPEMLAQEAVVFPAGGDTGGLRLIKVPPGSLPELLGLKEGDIIVEIDGKRIKSASDVLAMARAGGTVRDVPIKYLRGDEELSVLMVLSPKTKK